MGEKLLPCPFCGGEASFEEADYCGRTVFSVGCVSVDGDCIGYQMLATYSRRSEAAAAWNTRPAAQTPDLVAQASGWDPRYRQLSEGEIIREGDECLTDSPLGWQADIRCIGTPAPDPAYTSHRKYRRLLDAAQEPAGQSEAKPVRDIVASIKWHVANRTVNSEVFDDLVDQLVRSAHLVAEGARKHG